MVQKNINEVNFLPAFESYLNELVENDAFSGSVLLAYEGKPLFLKAYGIANFSCGQKNQIDTKFNLGSMNKMFTSVAIAQLAQNGKLGFTDTLEKLLGEYPNKTAASKITVEQLLTHTSGLGDYFNQKYENASKLQFKKIADYFPLFVNEPLEFEPGTRFRYSNAGYMVLGAIIEQLSHQDYFDYVKERIYKPAGMINSDAYELDYDIPNLAVGYTASDQKGLRKNNLFLHVVKGGPAGGGYSTAEDLLRFALALQSHKLLNPKYTELITKGRVTARNGMYAYGFLETSLNNLRIVGHAGGFAGISSSSTSTLTSDMSL